MAASAAAPSPPNPPTVVRNNLKTILDKVSAGYDDAPVKTRAPARPRLVAVSKTKPIDDIIAAYQAGQRHFGENYVQELKSKSNDPLLTSQCPDIKWHFIGNCQTNKANLLGDTANLSCVETILSTKLADKIQFQLAKRSAKVDVMVQVNTSGEENKNGVAPGPQTVALVRHVADKCPNLVFKGLMTIGALGNSVPREATQPGSNPDFLTLIQCRKDVAQELQVEESSLELSMGMSNDFLEAIAMGSTNIRVGSSIFGARNYPAAKPPPPPPPSEESVISKATEQMAEAKISS